MRACARRIVWMEFPWCLEASLTLRRREIRLPKAGRSKLGALWDKTGTGGGVEQDPTGPHKIGSSGIVPRIEMGWGTEGAARSTEEEEPRIERGWGTERASKSTEVEGPEPNMGQPISNETSEQRECPSPA